MDCGKIHKEAPSKENAQRNIYSRNGMDMLDGEGESLLDHKVKKRSKKHHQIFNKALFKFMMSRMNMFVNSPFNSSRCQPYWNSNCANLRMLERVFS